MDTVPTYCPEHLQVELRREGNYDTAFCLQCLKHHPMCTAIRYMTICAKIKGHENPHVDRYGLQWNEGSLEILNPKFRSGEHTT